MNPLPTKGLRQCVAVGGVVRERGVRRPRIPLDRVCPVDPTPPVPTGPELGVGTPGLVSGPVSWAKPTPIEPISSAAANADA